MEDIARFILAHIPELLLSGALAVLGVAYKNLVKEFKKQAVERGAIKNLLRSEIIDLHRHYMECGDIPIYGRENITELYNAYHELGGNGMATKLVDEVMSLPTRSK